MAALIDILKAAYPSAFKKMTDQEKIIMATTWFKFFENEETALVCQAARSYISTNDSGFPPTIAHIIRWCNKIKDGCSETISEMEAWNMVYKAVSNSYYNSQAEFEKLPKQIQAAIGHHKILKEWSTMDISTFQSVVQSNFMRSYRAKQETSEEYTMIPDSIKEYTKMIGSEFPDIKLIGE